MAIQRAEDKTAQMQARAGAIDELLASGALDDPTGTAKDDITLELEQLASTSEVENELARMKASLGAGPAAAAPAIEEQPGRQPSRPAPTARSVTSSPPGQASTRLRRQRLRRRSPAEPGRPAMIVRILSEGQWELADDAVTELNPLDDEVEQAVRTG